MGFNIDFYKDLDKKKKYEYFINDLKEYLEKEEDSLANLSNSASFIYAFLENINWAGFYLLKENQLVLGPFCGLPATSRIDIGKGVCGTAFEKRETIVVGNVCEFPGHITCDVRSKSEIVMPLIKDEKIYGVLDIDSSAYSNFGEEEVEVLEKVMKVIFENVDFEKFM